MSTQLHDRAELAGIYMLRGRAHPIPEGTTAPLDSLPVWSICRVVMGYGDITTTDIEHPNGSQEFAFCWDQRHTYAYR